MAVEYYFKRFDWARELSHIPLEQSANYARVYMGPELNNALKFLVSPIPTEELTYEELRTTLINHFDRARNKYVESIKFRQIMQQQGETISNFTLRLKQGAAHCEYGECLERMLIEQLLQGLELREIYDEIIAQKPATFAKAYEIAHTAEATHNTTTEVKTPGSSSTAEAAHKLRYAPQQTRYSQKFSSSNDYR